MLFWAWSATKSRTWPICSWAYGRLAIIYWALWSISWTTCIWYCGSSALILSALVWTLSWSNWLYSEALAWRTLAAWLRYSLASSALAGSSDLTCWVTWLAWSKSGWTWDFSFSLRLTYKRDCGCPKAAPQASTSAWVWALAMQSANYYNVFEKSSNVPWTSDGSEKELCLARAWL